MASSARIDELKKKFDENPRRYFAPLANEYRKAGDLDQAIFICQEYLPQQPGHMSGHIVYAQTLYEMGRHDEAKAAFEAALALDPENLIALRHLGDIARQAGDLTEARAWYERVLEADPRNEEIVEAMASLHGAPAPQSTTTTSATSADVAEPTAPALRTPALSFPLPEPPRPSPYAPAAPVPSAPLEEDVGPGEELLDLDEMTFGGASLSTPSGVGSVASGSPENTPESNAANAEAFSEQTAADADFSREEEVFESDPFAMAANEEPPIEMATDLNLGLIDDGSDSDSTPVVDAIEGLHSFEAGVLAHSAELVESDLDMKPFYDILHGDAGTETPAPSAADDLALERASEEHEPISPSEFEDLTETPPSAMPATPAGREPTPPVATQIFVTETMAELYLQQGHFDSALDIYRQLLEQRPNDPSLLERVQYAEARLFGVAEPAVEETPAASGTVQTGPTIREFLVSLIAGRSASHAPSGQNGQSGEATASMSRATLPGSIDALFPGTGASSTDSTAATALAGAFGLGDLDADLGDQSAHAEADEASLDRPLAANTPSGTDAVADGFSFDQFFSGDANAPSAKPPVDAGKPPVESPEDIAQFNAWLSGLKKT